MARANKVLLELHPHSVVDCFDGVHERGERKYYTEAEAAALLAFEYGGRSVFRRVDESNPEVSEDSPA